MKTTIEIDGINLMVDYDYEPEEPMVWRYPDGSGHPGSPEIIWINSVKADEVDIYDLLHNNVIEEIEENIKRIEDV